MPLWFWCLLFIFTGKCKKYVPDAKTICRVCKWIPAGM